MYYIYILDSKTAMIPAVSVDRSKSGGIFIMTEETKNKPVVDQEVEEIWVDDINELYEEEYTAEQIEEMESLLATSMTDIKEGEVIEGKIVNINQVGVAVDIGFKSEGMIDLDEFDDLDSINRGDMISVFLEAVEGRRGELVLSK